MENEKREIYILGEKLGKSLECMPDGFKAVYYPKNPCAIIVSGKQVGPESLTSGLLAIARAGVDASNIPVEDCTEKGVVVFYTPGADANSVKELAMLGILMLARPHIPEAITWTKNLSGQSDDMPKMIRLGKEKFKGTEIAHKTLGIIGLGHVGSIMVRPAESLGMKVIGYDPYRPVSFLKSLSYNMRTATGFDEILPVADFLSINVPYDPVTKKNLNFIGAPEFSKMKPGVRILNLTQGELVDTKALKEAIDKRIVDAYLTDFPADKLLKMENVICLPHLKAVTVEAEESFSVMAMEELGDYILHGNIRNSANYPDCILELAGKYRITIDAINIPGMVNKVTDVLKENIANMQVKSRDRITYIITDTDTPLDKTQIKSLQKQEGVKRLRVLY